MADQKPTTQKILAPIDEIRNNFSKLADQFKLVLPPQITPEKFIRVAMTAIQQTPDLLAADRNSLYGAAIKCATDGLVPDGREAAFIVFSTNVGTKENKQYIKKVQYMPMVFGIIKKVRNSGELHSLNSGVVYPGDEFEYYIDEHGPHLKHKPAVSRESVEATHAYAIVKLKDGAIFIEVMTRAEIEAVRAVSKSATYGPWASWWSEMARKTVIKRLSKILPMNSEVRDAIDADNDLFEPSEAPPQVEPSTKPKKLAAALEAKEAEEVHPAAEPLQETSEPPI